MHYRNKVNRRLIVLPIGQSDPRASVSPGRSLASRSIIARLDTLAGIDLRPGSPSAIADAPTAWTMRSALRASRSSCCSSAGTAARADIQWDIVKTIPHDPAAFT